MIDTELAVNVTIGIGGLVVGIGIGEVLDRTLVNPKLPKWLKWLRVERVVHFLMICLALSTMLTTYAATRCQAEYNERDARRTARISEAQTNSTDSFIKAIDGLLADNPNPNALIILKSDLEAQQATRRNNPPETEIRC